MEIVIGLVALAVGVVGGWVLGMVRAAERVRRAEVRAAEAAARLDAERRVADERVAAAQADQDRLREQFRALAAEALQ
ncbi:MAG: DNA recombination protein RmuC, partial [Actinomycetales bacterium]|nr:DNA recombination protein RmuC [Actinomycetales bacterium]